MTLEDMYGAWHLISIYAENQAGEQDYYLGKDASGRLSYHRDGYMTAFLMSHHRPSISRGAVGASDAEVRKVYNSYEAYSGTFSVDFDAGIVTHHVDLARSPHMVGSDQTRYFAIKDDILHIHTPPLGLPGQERVIYLQWERRS